MPWCWELPEWPHFQYDKNWVVEVEKQFLLAVGQGAAYLKTVGSEDRKRCIVDILSMEGQESARIEGGALDRESLQSSIGKHFGLKTTQLKAGEREVGMANLLCSAYDTYDKKLTHKMVWTWHALLFEGRDGIEEKGQYRTHPDPMQIVSNRYGDRRVFFEALPSNRVPKEMEAFITWFNKPNKAEPLLAKAAIAHLYFEMIHPFEDGNGRLGRVLVEKALSQDIGQPVLIPLSKQLEKRRKEYYAALESCNRSLSVQSWIEFFCSAVIDAHKDVMQLLHFLLAKGKLLRQLEGELNARQTKALLRMFREGVDGFKGGLSAENYIAITGSSRATATRDLADLVNKGALFKKGSLKHTRYFLRFEEPT